MHIALLPVQCYVSNLIIGGYSMTVQSTLKSSERVLWRCEEDGSDKDYVTCLTRSGQLWSADYEFGAHGGKMKSGTKMPGGPDTYEIALKAYDAMVAERLRKGYVPQGAEGAALVARLVLPYARRAHVPVVAPTQTPGRETRYFGRPWMPETMAWPEQGGKPMHFVLQLDTASMPQPHALSGMQGLLLFFHGGGYGDDQSCLVLVDPALPGSLRQTPSGISENPALAVVSWREVVDQPWGDDCEEIPFFEKNGSLLELMGEDTVGMLVGADGQTYTEMAAVEQGIVPMGHSFECDKLGGWPRWEQGDDTPKDSDGKPMRFLMQVGHEGLVAGSLEGLDIQWPTWGRGQIFVSDATGEFSYVWACD